MRQLRSFEISEWRHGVWGICIDRDRCGSDFRKVLKLTAYAVIVFGISLMCSSLTVKCGGLGSDLNFLGAQAIAIHLQQPKGDLLIFMTGQEEIEATCFALQERLVSIGDTVPPMLILPIYSQLPADLQVPPCPSELFSFCVEGGGTICCLLFILVGLICRSRFMVSVAVI